MIIMEWRQNRKDKDGYKEFLPDDFLDRQGNIEYKILKPDGEIISAKCAISKDNNLIFLQYGLQHEDFNTKNGVEVGESQLEVVGDNPPELKSYKFRAVGGEFVEVEVFMHPPGRVFGDEGSPKLASHLRRERKQYLVREKIAFVHASGKPIRCEACDFDFGDVYPELGKGFCEVHHQVELSKGPRVTSLEELALLCANCHRMIHRTGDPMLSVQEFAARHIKLSN